MPELKQRPGDQPLPVPNGHTDIQTLVIDDIDRRREVGIGRYGTALQPHNGRDALRDAYEEAMDLTMYLRQAMVERETALRTTAPCDWCGETGVSDVVTMTYSAGNRTNLLLCPPCTGQALDAPPSIAKEVRRIPLPGTPAPIVPPPSAPPPRRDAEHPVGDSGVGQADELHAAAERLRAVARAAREERRRDPQWNGRHTYGQEISASLGGPCGDLAELWDPDQADDLAGLLDELADHIIEQTPGWESDPQMRVPVGIHIEQRYARTLAITRRINAVKEAVR